MPFTSECTKNQAYLKRFLPEVCSVRELFSSIHSESFVKTSSEASPYSIFTDWLAAMASKSFSTKGNNNSRPMDVNTTPINHACYSSIVKGSMIMSSF